MKRLHLHLRLRLRLRRFLDRFRTITIGFEPDQLHTVRVATDLSSGTYTVNVNGNAFAVEARWWYPTWLVTRRMRRKLRKAGLA